MARFLKALCVLFVLSALLLCGCTRVEKESKSVVTDFTADFSAELKGLEIEGKISAARQGVVSISITEPETLEGIEISYKNSELQLSRDSLICTASEAYIPQSGFPSMVKKLLSDAANLDFKPDDVTKLGDFELYIDSGGKIISAENKTLDFSIEFSNITPIGE